MAQSVLPQQWITKSAQPHRRGRPAAVFSDCILRLYFNHRLTPPRFGSRCQLAIAYSILDVPSKIANSAGSLHLTDLVHRTAVRHFPAVTKPGRLDAPMLPSFARIIMILFAGTSGRLSSAECHVFGEAPKYMVAVGFRQSARMKGRNEVGIRARRNVSSHDVYNSYRSRNLRGTVRHHGSRYSYQKWNCPRTRCE